MNLTPLSTDADYERYAALNNAIQPPPPVTGPEIRSRDTRRSRPGARFLIEKGGEEVGTANFYQSEFVADRGRFTISVFVDRNRLGEGIATGAQALLMAKMAPHAPTILRPLSAVRLTTLAAEQERLGVEAARRLLWQLDEHVGPDVPSDAPEVTPPFPEWEKILMSGPGFRPEAFFLAVEPGGEYVGISMLFHLQATSDLNTGLTGVRRDWRRHGIALALKLMAIDYAKALGAPRVRTENATTNRPMLSINEALGFEKDPVTICYKKVLAS